MTHWYERDDYYGIITFILLCLLVIYSAWLMSWLVGILSDTTLGEPKFKETHGISRAAAQSLKTISMVLLIITLIFVTTFIWETISETYKLHELIANSKTAIITSAILLAVIIWAQSDMGDVPDNAGGAGPALKQFNVSLIVILSIAMAIFAIPMILKSKDAALSYVEQGDEEIAGFLGGGGKKKGRATAPGRLESKL